MLHELLRISEAFYQVEISGEQIYYSTHTSIWIGSNGSWQFKKSADFT